MLTNVYSLVCVPFFFLQCLQSHYICKIHSHPFPTKPLDIKFYILRSKEWRKLHLPLLVYQKRKLVKCLISSVILKEAGKHVLCFFLQRFQYECSMNEEMLCVPLLYSLGSSCVCWLLCVERYKKGKLLREFAGKGIWAGF